MKTLYVIWNKQTKKSKLIDADDYGLHGINRLYRFYSEHPLYEIERCENV